MTSNVDKGHWRWHKSKSYHFLLVLCIITVCLHLLSFPRYLTVNNGMPLQFGSSFLHWKPQNSIDQIRLYSYQSMFLCPFVSAQYQRATDGQTDTDRCAPGAMLIVTQLNWTQLTHAVEQRTAKLVLFLFMTSPPTNWVNCCSRCRVELSWVVSL